MADNLELPADLLSLIEKRESEDRRGADSEEASKAPAEAAPARDDSPTDERRSGADRRRKE